MFYHPITEFVFKEFLWEAKTQLDDIAHNQTITCRQLFAGNRDGLSANEKEEKIASSDNNSACA